MPELGSNCSPAQCDDAIAYLIAGFGPWYDDQEKRQLRRLFLEFTPMEVTEAIDQLCKQWDRNGKPRTSDLGPLLKANRRHLQRMAEMNKPVRAAGADVEPPERDWLHEMVAAVKTGDHQKIEELQQHGGAPWA